MFIVEICFWRILFISIVINELFLIPSVTTEDTSTTDDEIVRTSTTIGENDAKTEYGSSPYQMSTDSYFTSRNTIEKSTEDSKLDNFTYGYEQDHSTTPDSTILGVETSPALTITEYNTPVPESDQTITSSGLTENVENFTTQYKPTTPTISDDTVTNSNLGTTEYDNPSSVPKIFTTDAIENDNTTTEDSQVVVISDITLYSEHTSIPEQITYSDLTTERQDFNKFEPHTTSEQEYVTQSSGLTITEADTTSWPHLNGATSEWEQTNSSKDPTAVEFTVTGVAPTSFSIHWMGSNKGSGNITKYHILIVDLGPDHFVRNESRQSYPVQFSVDEDEQHNSHTFNKAKPDHKYDIKFAVENQTGNSTWVTRKIITKSSRSTKPLNVTSHIITPSNHCNGNEFSSTLAIRWELPRDTNGKLKEFQIQLRKRHRQEKESYSITDTIAVPKNSQEDNVIYERNVTDLKAASMYSFTITPISVDHNRIGTSSDIKSEITPDGCPARPYGTLVRNLTRSEFSVIWKEPNTYYGQILEYEVEIETLNPNHLIPKDNVCMYEYTKIDYFFENGTQLEFTEGKANYNYRIRIRAKTSAGFGDYSTYEYATTDVAEPETIRNLTIATIDDNISNYMFEYKVKLEFKQPCNTNDQFKRYAITAIGIRNGYPNDSIVYNNLTNFNVTNKVIILKKPEYNYTFEVAVITEHFKSDIVKHSIVTSAGVPPVNSQQIQFSIKEDNPTQVDIIFTKTAFDNANGQVMYYAILLLRDIGGNPTLQYNYSSYGFWNSNWPKGNETITYHENLEFIGQLTPDFWNPFTNVADTQVTYTLGKTNNCSSQRCDSLSENTNYIIVVRGLTKSSFVEVYILAKTGKSSSQIALIIVSVLACLLAFAVLCWFLFKKKDLPMKFRSIAHISLKEEETQKHVVLVKDFISYYNKIRDDLSILKKQYDEIDDEIKIYKQESVHNTFSQKPENKRKNRYANILPYDEYRVKLNIDEDDEIGSDYINASYVKGFSGEIEYIATQGPLEHTCKDFWKMVIQENVTLIVMVSQFVEKEKEKSYKYFPNTHENMLISEDLEVRCCTELQFDTYCIRTLQVRKDIEQYNVVHMQYLEWPDFGCPNGTNNMLYFCQEVRDRIQLEKGLMVVHCSAGVGRTGTLISLDILLQAIANKKKKISIFETVMELRKQRTHMVQTEKQYIYIHTCIRDLLENRSFYMAGDEKKNEAQVVYENLKQPGNSTENESAF